MQRKIRNQDLDESIDEDSVKDLDEYLATQYEVVADAQELQKTSAESGGAAAHEEQAQEIPLPHTHGHVPPYVCM